VRVERERLVAWSGQTKPEGHATCIVGLPKVVPKQLAPRTCHVPSARQNIDIWHEANRDHASTNHMAVSVISSVGATAGITVELQM